MPIFKDMNDKYKINISSSWANRGQEFQKEKNYKINKEFAYKIFIWK